MSEKEKKDNYITIAKAAATLHFDSSNSFVPELPT